MQDFILFIKDKKNAASLLSLAILILAIPLGVNLFRGQLAFLSRAAAEPIEIGDGRCIEVRGGVKVLKCGEIPLKLTAPKGEVPPDSASGQVAGVALAQLSAQANTVEPPKDVDLQFECRNGSPKATITWDRSPTDDIDTYQIQKRVGGGDWRDFSEISGRNRSKDDEQVTNGQDYAYRVRARKASRNSSYAEGPTKSKSCVSSPAPSPTPPPPAGGGFEGAIVVPDNCGTIDTSRVNRGSPTGQLFYTGPTLRDSNLARCTVRLTLAGRSTCDYQIHGKGTQDNPLGSNETVEIDFGQGDKSCEVQLYSKNTSTQPPGGGPGPIARPPKIVRCSVNAATVYKGTTVTYRVDAEDGVRPYQVSWSGTEFGSRETSQDNTLSVTFNSPGLKTARVKVVDSVHNSDTVSCDEVSVTELVLPPPASPPPPPPPGSTQVPLRFVSCLPSAASVLPGQSITWKVSADGGRRFDNNQYRISWDSDERNAFAPNELGDTNKDTATGTFTAVGTKTVRVNVTDSAGQTTGTRVCQTAQVSATGGSGTGQPFRFISCRGSVTNGATGDVVTWRADAQGGTRFPDNKYQISWEGEGLIGDREGHTDFITAQYLNVGQKTAKVKITDAAGNSSDVKDCGPVEVTSPLLRAACRPNKATIKIGDSVTWAVDAEGGVRPYRLFWAGDAPINTQSTSDRQDVKYTTEGAKKAFVTVEDSKGHKLNNLSCGEVKVEQYPLLVTGYSIANSLTSLDSAPVNRYNTSPTAVNFTLADTTPGVKQIYVRYFYSRGNPDTVSKSITLVEPDPSVVSAVCKLDFTKENVVMDIKGSKFGDQRGQVSVANAPGGVDLLDWKNDEVTLLIKKASLDGNQSFGATVTRADGRVVNATCAVGVARISLGAKLFCREEGKNDQPNVQVTLVDDAGKKVTETVTISREGVIMGLKTKLQDDRQYVISIKSPKGLRRNAIFKASEGTAVASSLSGGILTLPVGDIFPQATDGVINTLDKAELNRQWRTLGSNTKELSGDFNQDSKVNAFDWACMRYDFDQRDEVVPEKAPDQSQCARPPVCTPPSTLITGDPGPTDPNRCPRFSCSTVATPSASPSTSPNVK